ncbi:hypothetical protein DUNSADRAFT_17149 [Dunaliella salina]|uniref:Uncharacterized protein n=1 Tax=Dunaliella salina TaxID=3046 RepID=A0ABQ7H0E5_DUNSA|nr:hypothetical protein DUNSADRAFT_17149 [Dunaliella salina]|eukprot:KAF5840305.1 hypothetical protein DUNSADRAFT_17149 [Dunaliella salina]
MQACPHTAWDTLLDGRPSSRYSMALKAPFLLPNPVRRQAAAATVSATQIGCTNVKEALDVPLKLQHVQALQSLAEQGRAGDEMPQQQQQPLQLRHEHVQVLHDLVEHGRAGDRLPQAVQEQEATCEFELVVSAPPEFNDGVLRGWQGPEDAPEELPEAVKSRSLCLLASLEGRFLRVWVKKESLRSSGERVAQVCVSLPSALGTPSRCPKALVLELWAVGALVCAYSAILLPCSSAGAAALAELRRVWAADGSPDGLPLPLEDSGPFVQDLVRLMRFGAQTQQRWQQQHTQGGVAATDADLMEERAQKEELCGDHPAAAGSLELTMAAVGMDLLAHSLSRGMEAVAGLLLECLASIPFSVPPSALLDTETLLARLHSLFAREEAAGEEGIETPMKGGYTL